MSNKNNKRSASASSNQSPSPVPGSGFQHKPSSIPTRKTKGVLTPMSKARRLAKKKLSPRASSASSPTISPLFFPGSASAATSNFTTTYSSQYVELTSLIKSLHRLTTNHNSNIPSKQIKSMEKMVNDFILQNIDHVSDFDIFLQGFYDSPHATLEQKCLLRNIVVGLFSSSVSTKKNQQSEDLENDVITLANVFAIPMFGKVSSFSQLAQNQDQIKKLCNLGINTGYFTQSSQAVALMNKPLNPRALYQPSVLRALSIFWASLISEESTDKDFIKSIREVVESSLAPYVVDENEICSFVVPGIRLWTGTKSERNDLSEVFNYWKGQTDISSSISRSLWQTMSGHISLSSLIDPGDLLIKPPSLPLQAHATSLAWHMTHQVYESLASTPFSEISLVSTGSKNESLCLRAYDKNKKIIAQSDHVPLFEATSSSEDFSNLIYEECGAEGPRTMLREIVRTLSYGDI